MKKILAGGLAALTLAGAAAATPAAAGPYWHRGGWGPGAAVGAGILGLAIGASIADHPRYAYPGPYHGPGYYGPAYYGSGYGCRPVVRWNPYLGGYQRVRACY